MDRADVTGATGATGASVPSSPEILPIDQAPPRIRREHYRRERRNGIMAVLVLAAVAALLGWGAYRLFR